eukprot:scaffold1138_cov128-Cylindrotheca_fusiformis.AAC.33
MATTMGKPARSDLRVKDEKQMKEQKRISGTLPTSEQTLQNRSTDHPNAGMGSTKRSFNNLWKMKTKHKSKKGDRRRTNMKMAIPVVKASDNGQQQSSLSRPPHATSRTAAAHSELPNPQQKDLLHLSNENRRLNEKLAKATDDHNRLKDELLQQKLAFEQQMNDLKEEIADLKKRLLESNESQNTSADDEDESDRSHTDSPPMRVDFAGDVVPFNESNDTPSDYEKDTDDASSSDDSAILDTVAPLPSRNDDKPSAMVHQTTPEPQNVRRFVSEDPTLFTEYQRRSGSDEPSAVQAPRRHTYQLNNKGRRAGLKLGAQPGIGTKMNKDAAALASMGASGILKQQSQLFNFVKQERLTEWVKSFRRSDPRYQILSFFDDIANQGAQNIKTGFDPRMASPLLRMFYKASVFTVWRPTSLDAIRRMMLGEGVGKGLDIKGKSAKKGKLSGYVPFLQIYKEEHKKQVRTHPRDGKIKVFFKSQKSRNHVVERLNELAVEMVETVETAKAVVEADEVKDDVMEWHLEKLIWEMTDPTIELLDDYAPNQYGMLVPERLFWQGMVVRQDISREPGSENDTGRPSEPNFQNMNCLSLRKEPEGDGPKTVILQYEHPDDENVDPMCPLNLVMAYEENGRVMPVVSDFDCFIVGTRGVKYEEPMADDQLDILKWCVDQIENVLDSGDQSKSWTSRWLEVLKTEASKGFHPEIPPLGFSDPKSNDMMKHAISRLRKEGAVRHGSECFNYYFPQELDDEFLVISNDLGCTLRWKYVDEKGLQEVLMEQIDKGYTFPINPKWILCDGWKRIYDKLIASQMPNVQDSLRMWYPPESGIRQKIEEIHRRHPNGFKQLDDKGADDDEDNDGTAAMDLAEQELRAYLTFQRAKRKLRGIFVWRRLLLEMRRQHQRRLRKSTGGMLTSSHSGGDTTDESDDEDNLPPASARF